MDFPNNQKAIGRREAFDVETTTIPQPLLGVDFSRFNCGFHTEAAFAESVRHF